MMRVADGDGERVGGIVGVEFRPRQQHRDHHADLLLLRVAGADDRLLHRVRRVFGDRKAGRAGTSMATPRAWPSFSVAAGVAR